MNLSYDKLGMFFIGFRVWQLIFPICRTQPIYKRDPVDASVV